jgi:hypothetical protein
LSRQSAERRAHQRVETTVQVQGTPQEGGVVARMVANNLSLGGLYCTSSADFPEMTRLAVRLMLPLAGDQANKLEPLDLEAVVVRREKRTAASGEPQYELALFFTGMDDATRKRLASFVDAPAPKIAYH